MGWSDESRERCRALVAELSDLLAGGVDTQPSPPEAREAEAQAEEEDWVNWYIRQEEEEGTSYEEEQRLTQLYLDQEEEEHAFAYRNEQ